ncbi:MAG: glycoside hydrolase family 97 catalytic domain-containing protein [Gammaproteobacteria bacterium]
MHNRSPILAEALALAFTLTAACIPAHALNSPDKHIRVDVAVTAQNTLTYSVWRDNKPVLLASPLGLKLEGADLAANLKLAKTSPVKSIVDSYQMAVGKKKNITYRANEQVFAVKSADGHSMDVVFRASNDGVAFRYVVADASLPVKRFVSEATGFKFEIDARSWLQPMSVAQTGWSNSNPSYEEHYLQQMPVGWKSPLPSGWVFPALFKTEHTWVAITEANLDGSFHASRLNAESPDTTYTIGLPMPQEVTTGGRLLAETTGTMVTPWRVIALGTLPTVMHSTLGTDLAAQAKPFDKKLIQPGHASWSWALLKDDFTTFEVQKKFIDYAADMKWDYTLVDADWDRKIGYEKLAELAKYAQSKGVGLLAWYNSSGKWNETPYTPKGMLLTHEQRVAEFKRLVDAGVKGVKVDFFGGDGQSMIQYYVDILKDAADAGLLVNFHGATLPRGWARTWPNLMTAEAIRGLEFTTFTQEDQDKVVRHAATIPFTRNLFDPMDFTPMVFGDIPKIKRATRNGFELAESVLFVSGIQHFAEIPEGMATAPAYVKTMLQDLPRQWDDVRFVAGYPGSHVVIARRAGNAWYVAGINAEGYDMPLDLDLSFLGKRKGTLITDGAGEREFTQADIDGGKTRVTIKPAGGFVAVFK